MIIWANLVSLGMVIKSKVVERIIWICPSKSLSRMPGRTCIPCRVELTRPKISPKVLGGRGPKTPVGTIRGLLSEVSTVSVAAQRSSPALPAVALHRSVMWRHD